VRWRISTSAIIMTSTCESRAIWCSWFKLRAIGCTKRSEAGMFCYAAVTNGDLWVHSLKTAGDVALSSKRKAGMESDEKLGSIIIQWPAR
jgi:hypothetical protein